MKTLMEYLREESGEKRKFGNLLEILSNSPCQLGTLTSESLSETFISVMNLLVNVHFIFLHQENIYNMIFHE